MKGEQRMQKLEEINWQVIETCYGSAADIPKWIAELTSPDETVRRNAFERIASEVYHQGSIYEASAYVVPFLIDLLPRVGEWEKRHLLALLTLLVTGVPAIDEDHLWLKPILEQSGRHFEQEMQEAKQHVVATRAAVLSGLPVFLSLLQDASADVRSDAAILIKVTPGVPPDVLPLAQAHIIREWGG
jgi:hypothetical protein